MTEEKLCPRCGKNPAIIDNTYGVLPCEKCQKEDEQYHLKEPPEFYTISKHNRITEQRDKYAKDIEQPFVGKNNDPNPDFVKAYPDKVHDYFSERQLRKL